MIIPQRLTDQVVQTLEERIRRGEYPEGQRLTELGVARELGVSQVTVRASFQELVARGLLEARPHRGTYVRQTTQTERREARVVRAALEALAAELVGAKVVDCAKELRQGFDKFVNLSKLRDENGTAQANHEFHRTIVRAAGNGVLLRVWEGLHDSPTSGPSYAGLSAVLEDMAQAHLELVEAAETGDSHKLAKMLKSHPMDMERIIDRASNAKAQQR